MRYHCLLTLILNLVPSFFVYIVWSKQRQRRVHSVLLWSSWYKYKQIFWGPRLHITLWKQRKTSSQNIYVKNHSYNNNYFKRTGVGAVPPKPIKAMSVLDRSGIVAVVVLIIIFHLAEAEIGRDARYWRLSFLEERDALTRGGSISNHLFPGAL